MLRVQVVSFRVVFLLVVFHTSYSQLIFKKGAPHVKCDSGFFTGKVRESRNNQTYYDFQGLRYAKQPERFKPAELYLEDGDEVYHAVTPGNRCPQQFGPHSIGEEDCLFLNVHVPMRPPPLNDGFPVMVWIHGGGFSFGSGDGYQPGYFMDENVILITLNYRLGPFGFLSTGDEVVSGNMGLQDQVVALQWVQRNIDKFGGDKKRVTIFGNSAGAASVHYLLMSPMAKGLFSNAIAQSGSAHNFWAFSPQPSSSAQELGRLMECNLDSSKTLVDCLKGKTVQEILMAQSRMKKWHMDPLVPFGPTVELSTGGSEIPFLSDYPSAIIQRREFSKVPLMIGWVKNEGLSLHAISVLVNERLTSELDSDFDNIAPLTLNIKSWFPEDKLQEIAKEIRKFYFGNKRINWDTMQNLTNMYSDASFIHGVWKMALEHAVEQPVYPYMLSFFDESSSSITKLFSESERTFGVAHGDDIQYLFKSTLFAEEVPRGSEAEKFSQRLVKLWASFATHRKPTETWGTAETWPSISQYQLQGNKPFLWYELDKDTQLLENPNQKRIKFWDKLIRKYSVKRSSAKDEL